MKRTIAVLDPAMNTPETDCFNFLVSQSTLPLTYHLPKLGGMASLHNLAENPVGILILGSASSVNDGFEWQKEMGDWLRPQLLSGTPAFGFCFGHQFLAHLFGGTVGYVHPEQTKYRGMRKVKLKANSLWGKQVEGELAVSHNEEVKTCPPGFSVVGTSELIAIDALAHNDLPIWSLQSHPESTPSFFKSHTLPNVDFKTALAFGHSLTKRFLDHVAQAT